MSLRSTRRKSSLRIESLEGRRVLSADALSHDNGPGDVQYEMECEVELHRGLDDDSSDDTFDDQGTDDGGTPDSSYASTELEARLTGDSLARGQAKFEIELEHGTEKRELTVEVRGAQPASVLDVAIDGVPVGQVQADATGEGRLELSSHPGDDELPLPDNFPAVHAGSSVTVGDQLSGTFVSEAITTNDDSTDDDSSDDSSNGSTDDSSVDVTDDSSNDSTDDSRDDVTDDVSEVFLVGLLSGDSNGWGRAKFEREFSAGVGHSEFEVHVKGLAARSVHNVLVDGVIVGQLTVSDDGMGELELKTNPKPVGELPFPADFPTISSGSVVTVGTVLAGSLSQAPVQHADLNDDDHLDAADIDHVFAAVRAGSQDDRFDLNDDQQVDDKDGRFLVEAVFGSSAGDTNLDGIFSSDDLILVFQHGEYEDSVSGNSGWSSGDWNGDGEFDSSDLVAAFQSGRYR